MDQEERMDFKALRAKFQDEELLLRQPMRIRPAVPEKPKVVPPPPQSPPHLPAGARPSLLTSISPPLEGKPPVAPRVVFKDVKAESKKPLIQPKKDKTEGKPKKGKDKTTKESKEKLKADSLNQKQKKGSTKDKKEAAAQLVPATPPPKPPTAKKSFLGFRRSSKRDSVVVPDPDPILDTLSAEIPGIAPLIPVPSDIGDAPPEPETSLKGPLPNIPTLPEPSPAVESTPSFIIPASPDFTPPPAFIPDIPVPAVPILKSETPQEIETPVLPVSRPDSLNETIPSPPFFVPTSPPSSAFSSPPPVVSTPSPSPPEPEIAIGAGMQAVNIAAVETPPPPVIDPPSIPASPKAPRPISALSALERVDLIPGKRTPACDQRIISALEKARRKSTSMTTNSPASRSITPPSEEQQSPTGSLPDLPPIDYVDRAGKPSPKPAQVNGFDHGHASPVLEGIVEEASESVPVLLMIPPPLPRKPLPDDESLGPALEKPERPPSVNLSEFIPPPPLIDNEILAPPELSEPDTIDVPEFDDVVSEAQSPQSPVSEWGNEEFSGPDTPDEQNPPEVDNNRVTPESEVQESEGQAGLQAQVDGVYEITDNMYEDISAAKKKGKLDGGKKRKGPPKNPYAETPQETNEEKPKTIKLFNKNDKKTTAEGPDEKELKKREKQRLEKEKKELKERQEREKKEQKEREKKENEMKKKFKITGQEDAMYEAKVTVTTKGRKSDLPVKNGDLISIIRTTNCPKGKWLARDSGNNYGYVAVDHVELDIKEMLEMGKKAACNHKSISSAVEVDACSTGSRASNHYPLSPESYDSEEWTGDDDEPLCAPPDNTDSLAPVGHTRTLSMPEMGNKDLVFNHQHSNSDISPDVEASHEALQKLATFFHSSKPAEPAASSTEPETSRQFSPQLVTEEDVQMPEASSTEEDFELSDIIILPPPELYADLPEE